MFKKKSRDVAPQLWIPTSQLPATPVSGFYQRLDTALQAAGFGDAVRAECAPYYEQDRRKGGRPGIDPEVYFKMLLVGFFENLASERAIAARCADSLSIRAFLRYELTEATPHHSSFTVIRQRLPLPVYEAVFDVILRALRQNKLLKGRRLAIDSSVIEANAAMRSLTHRLTGEEYRKYVEGLAKAAGVDPTDARAVASFDRSRPGRKTSNDEWENPHDPDAKVGPDKKGVTRMIYKPEHVVDTETGAIVSVDVRPGDEADGTGLAEKNGDAEARINRASGEDGGTEQVELVAADMGYFRIEELAALQHGGILTAVSDPVRKRQTNGLGLAARQTLARAHLAAASAIGKETLGLRGPTVERSFAHSMDSGGGRRSTLRGIENVTKRHLVRAAAFNLSLLLRHLTGVGTPKQAMAAAAALFMFVWGLVMTLIGHVVDLPRLPSPKLEFESAY